MRKIEKLQLKHIITNIIGSIFVALYSRKYKKAIYEFTFFFELYFFY